MQTVARPDKCPRWARGNRVKGASAANAVSAPLTRLSTPVRSRNGASPRPGGCRFRSPADDLPSVTSPNSSG